MLWTSQRNKLKNAKFCALSEFGKCYINVISAFQSTLRKTGAHLDPCYACIQSSLLCVEVPRILTCCCEAIEQHGIIDGIYRLSGRAVLVQKLRFVCLASSYRKVPAICACAYR